VWQVKPFLREQSSRQAPECDDARCPVGEEGRRYASWTGSAQPTRSALIT
jgi:hypothetical protein